MTGYLDDQQLGEALKDCNVVVIPAGVPRKPGEHYQCIEYMY